MARRFSSAELIAHADGVRALARSLLGDANAADDVVQDACVAALRDPPADDVPPRAWFVGVVRNLTRRTFRARSRRDARERAVARPESVPSAAHAAAEIETHRRLVDAVGALDEPYRTAIVLRFFDGLAPAEIAARLGVPVATVNTHVHRGVATLRARLDRDRDDWRRALLVLLAPLDRTPTPLVPLAGAIAMTAKQWVLVAAGLLALVAGGAWIASRGSGAPTDGTRSASVSAVAPARGSRAKPPAPPPHAAPAADAPLPAPIDLDKCDRDLDLHGVVVTADGKPVAGASIVTVTRPWRDTDTFNYDAFDDEVRGPSTRSAADGTFALRLARGDAVMLRVSASGFASREQPLRQAGERVRIVLDAGVRLTVTIRDVAGAPLAGVPFRIAREYQTDDTFRRDGVTGADGRATVGLPGGLTCYAVQGPKSRVALPVTRVALPASGDASVEIVATGECRALTGRVLDDDTGRAIEGARVGLGENFRVETATGADGAFVLPEWNGDANSELHVVAAGHARAVAFAGDGRSLEFRMTRDASASGRVVGADGAPIAGAMVSVVAFRMDARPWGFSAGYATTAADGRFRVAGLTRDVPHALIVASPGSARTVRRVAPQPDGADVGDVVLAAPRAIEGRVLAGDVPVGRAKVTLLESADVDAASRGVLNRDRCTDDLGRFRFRDLAPGRYTMIVQPAGAAGTTTSVDVPADGDVLDLVVRVPSTRNVVVRVRDAAGAPVAGMWVAATSRGGGVPSNARTDDSGAATLAVPLGDVTVHAFPTSADAQPFVAPDPLRVDATAKEAVIVMRQGVHTTGRVVGPDGASVAGAPVAVVQAGGRSTQAIADADGRFDAVVAPEGVLDLSFDGLIPPDRGPSAKETGLRAHLTGVAPGSRDVVLRCERVASDRTLRVLVVDPDGTPVPDASFWYTTGGDIGQGTMAFAKTGSDGRATLTGLTPRELTLATNIHGDWFASIQVRATPDGGEVKLAYRTAIVISGAAAWPDGSVPKKCEARLSRGDAFVVSNDADAEGRFRLPAPADERGPYVVVVTGVDEKGRFEGRSGEIAGAAEGVRVVVERK